MATTSLINGVLSLVDRLVAFGFVLANVFLLLILSGRIEGYWIERRRAGRLEPLVGTDLDLDALRPYLEYTARHGTVVKPVLAALAAAALWFLATRASDETFLATSYAVTGIAFVLLAGVETVRYHRARRVARAVDADPVTVIESGTDRFPFVDRQAVGSRSDESG